MERPTEPTMGVTTAPDMAQGDGASVKTTSKGSSTCLSEEKTASENGNCALTEPVRGVVPVLRERRSSNSPKSASFKEVNMKNDINGVSVGANRLKCIPTIFPLAVF
jgi:hypothetical protein